MGLLAPRAKAAMAALGVETIEAVADRGDFRIEDIEACEAAGITADAPNPVRGPAGREGFFPKEAFHCDPGTDTFTCPGGQILRPCRRGVYPHSLPDPGIQPGTVGRALRPPPAARLPIRQPAPQAGVRVVDRGQQGRGRCRGGCAPPRSAVRRGDPRRREGRGAARPGRGRGGSHPRHG